MPPVPAAAPAEEAPEAAVRPFEETSVFCSRCGGLCHISRCRVRDKTKGTFTCNRCNTTMTQVTRGLGGKAPKFKNVPDDVLAKFFKDAKGKNQDDVLRACDKLLSEYTEHETYFVNKGQFLPLLAWTTQGFDGEKILENTRDCDKMDHPQLGVTYRVRLFESGDRGRQGHHSSEAVKAKAVPALAEAADPASRCSSSSSASRHRKKKKKHKMKRERSSSSSSSSSSRHRKKKKHKKSGKKDRKRSPPNSESKAETKAREMLEKVQAKELAVQSTKRRKLASDVIAKLAPVVAPNPARESINLPPPVKDIVSQNLKKCSDLYEQAQKCLADPDAEMDVESVKDIVPFISDLKKSDAMVTSILNRIAMFG